MPAYEPNYVVGRGRIYFNQFKPGSNVSAGGELYFGNTPELTINTDSETLDHYSSESGLREMDMRVLLELTQGGTFTTDEVNADNLALFFLGEKAVVTQTQVTGKKEVIPAIRKARYIQIGTDANNPTGVRDINNLTVGVVDANVAISVGSGDISTISGISMVPLAGNFEVDLATGRLYVEPDAPDVGNGQQAVLQYDVNPQVRTMIIGRSAMVYGSLRFISDNPVGSQKDYFFPKVALQPDGDYALKGDDWQVMSFTFSALRLNSATERVYIDIRDSSVAVSPADQRAVSVTNPPANGTVGTAANVTFTVRDGFNNIVPGAAMSFTATNGGQVTPASGVTNASGQITVQLNRTTAGASAVTATLSGTGQQVTSSATTFAAA
jgi:hypothetical protein